MTLSNQYRDGQFCWIELMAQDLDNAGEFYRQLFGWQCQNVAGQTGFLTGEFRLQGHLVAGIKQREAASKEAQEPAVWNSFVQVADVQRTAQQATQLGGQIVTPATKIEDAGWMARIQDPAGASLGLWQADQHSGAELVQDLHACCWNELGTRDVDTARDFYSQLFGWEFQSHPLPTAKYHVIENQGEQNGGMMLLDAGWGSMPPRWIVYFAVQSVDFSVDQVRQLGGSVFVPPYDIPEGRQAVVVDRQGAMFNLVEMNEDDQPSDE